MIAGYCRFAAVPTIVPDIFYYRPIPVLFSSKQDPKLQYIPFYFYKGSLGQLTPILARLLGILIENTEKRFVSVNEINEALRYTNPDDVAVGIKALRQRLAHIPEININNKRGVGYMLEIKR